MARFSAAGCCAWMVLACCLLLAAPVSADPPAKKLIKKTARKKQPPAPVFGFADVIEKARRLSLQPYAEPPKTPAISAEQHRDIHFVADKAYWRADKLPFELRFFHVGSYYDRSVKLFEVTQSGVAPIKFSPTYYSYDKSAADIKEQARRDMGFAGFGIHAGLQKDSPKAEVAVFLGASYFRAVGQDMRYGLSGRGLAVDTAQPEGEEFPWFRQFWLQRPQLKDKSITVYALLDSQRVTGAYTFVITPGAQTLMDVAATVFLRKKIEKIGMAPMTSMFFYGENTNVRPRDWYQPEVHNSDGLMINMESGEWLWRPIRNPRILWVNAFQADNIKGFGLMQRDRAFDHFQDLEARYDRRPSLWCTPKGDWGRGAIELVQIPTDDDIHDNIVAYWRPAALDPAKPLTFAYNLAWQYPDEKQPPGGRVVATRTETDKYSSAKTFIIDFEGGELGAITPAEGLEAVVDVGADARLLDRKVEKNDATGGWRLSFRVRPEDNPSLAEKIMPDKRPIVEMRAFLRRGTSILTETWLYGTQL